MSRLETYAEEQARIARSRRADRWLTLALVLAIAVWIWVIVCGPIGSDDSVTCAEYSARHRLPLAYCGGYAVVDATALPDEEDGHADI